ncbi:MAG: hypothetical protein DMG64_06445 [Acidobacteria bacterium]
MDGEFISLGRALLKNATVDHLTGELRMEAPLPQGSGSNDPRRNILLCDLPSRALERFLPGAVRSLKQRIVENDWDTDKSVDESMRLARMIRKRVGQSRDNPGRVSR